MENKFKFDIGSKVWVIQNCKASLIEVNIIQITKQSVWYGPNKYDLYLETECFATKGELLKYVAGE